MQGCGIAMLVHLRTTAWHQPMRSRSARDGPTRVPSQAIVTITLGSRDSGITLRVLEEKLQPLLQQTTSALPRRGSRPDDSIHLRGGIKSGLFGIK
jgi:hypothetical protein